MTDTLLLGADATNANALPAGLAWYAGYGNGQWPSAASIRARFPGVPVKVISTTGGTTAAELLCDVADIERGDYTPVSGPQWARAKLDGGAPSATLYFSADDLGDVNAGLRYFGLPPVSRAAPVLAWSAEWDGEVIVPDWAVAAQFANGPGYDSDVALSSWVLPAPAPPIDVRTRRRLLLSDDWWTANIPRPSRRSLLLMGADHGA